MDALGRVCNLLGVACRAFHFLNRSGVRKVLDCRMAVGATHDSMHAGSMFVRADRNILAAFRFHTCLAMTGEAGLILLEGLRRLFLAARQYGQTKKDEQAKSEEENSMERSAAL